jgi:superfamily II DNA or RNA helicase
MAEFPEEYAGRLGINATTQTTKPYSPLPAAFDFQQSIVKTAISKQKYAIFADCGLGKTIMFLEFARHVADIMPSPKRTLIISPLMVVEQTIEECQKFYSDSMTVDRIISSELHAWLSAKDSSRIGITNYEALRNENLSNEHLSGLILDESSMLKSHYGKYGTAAIQLGKGVPWKLCCTGTPAPNDRIEYANHAVFLDVFPTVNSFLARYFVNKSQKNEKWILKNHAIQPFARALSHWAIFLQNPATYGWKDVDTSEIPPIKVITHHVELTAEQKFLTNCSGQLFTTDPGGISDRAKWSSISKGFYKGRRIATNKLAYIKSLVESWPDESTIIWCLYNEEQKILEETFPDAASIKGSTPDDKRQQLIRDFKSGKTKVLVSKPRILGFGLNLQIATRQIFSGLQDSYESYYQAVKRSNRIGSKYPLNVHIPMTDLEEPMISNVMRKSRMIQQDTEEQERMFRDAASR